MITLNYINFLNFFLTSICMIMFSCQAPRDNPLDPANPDHILHTITGKVQTIALPSQPLADVHIQWEGPENATTTNSDGRYNLSLANAPSGWIFFSKSGYFSDSVYVVWGDAQHRIIDVFLNAQSHIDSYNIYSIIENRYPSLQTERFVVNATIIDSDNDIDSVFLHIPVFDQVHLLPYNTTEKRYERVFGLTDLNITSLDQLTGHDLQLRIKDIFVHSLITEVAPLKRVIRDEVLFIRPSGNEITGPQPTLRWESFSPGFPHQYYLEVFTSEVSPQRIWFSQAIADSVTEYMVDTHLEPDEYFWVIWAEDMFGNRTRSKPASFKVE